MKKIDDEEESNLRAFYEAGFQMGANMLCLQLLDHIEKLEKIQVDPENALDSLKKVVFIKMKEFQLELSKIEEANGFNLED
jgi:hypothetical protein